jgi:hypothetical protein
MSHEPYPFTIYDQIDDKDDSGDDEKHETCTGMPWHCDEHYETREHKVSCCSYKASNYDICSIKDDRWCSEPHHLTYDVCAGVLEESTMNFFKIDKINQFAFTM